MKQKNLAFLVGSASFFSAASVAFGAGTLISLSQSIQKNVFGPLITAITAYALLLFVWGVYRYIAHAGDEKAAAEGSKMMSYGVVILFVMVSVWGLVSLLMDTLGIPGAPHKVDRMEGVDFNSENAFYNNAA